MSKLPIHHSRVSKHTHSQQVPVVPYMCQDGKDTNEALTDEDDRGQLTVHEGCEVTECASLAWIGASVPVRQCYSHYAIITEKECILSSCFFMV